MAFTCFSGSKTYVKRGIKLSLRVFASMQAVHLFLRARAVINFLMRAGSILEITNGEQRAFGKFSASWNLTLLKRCYASKQDKGKAKQHDKALSRFNHSQ